MNRRRFLQIAGASALAHGCGPRRDAAIPRDDDTEADVVVIGGGLAGLTAARDLVAGGARTLVLEAGAEVGGRTRNQTVAGVAVEAGGAWVGPTQTALLGLCTQLGLATTPTYDTGDAVLLWGGDRVTGRGDFLEAAEAAELARTIAALDQLAATVPVDAPWRTPDAATLDARSVRDWLDGERASMAVRITLEASLVSTLGGAGDQVSLLYFLFYIASAGGLERLEAIASGAQERRIVGGSQRIAIELARGLGDRVRTSAPARAIIDEPGDPVRIETDAANLTATRVIVAMSPIDAARITPARAALGAAWRIAPGFKAHLAYDRAFWRDDGLSGQVMTDGVIEMTFDSSPPAGTPGILVVFANPLRLPPEPTARRDALIAALVPALGERARRATDYVEHDWAGNPFIAGCVSPLPPGVLIAHGPALREPAGRIHWAGTETSTVWTGYMDGAIRSGHRAAAEVLALITSRSATGST